MSSIRRKDGNRIENVFNHKPDFKCRIFSTALQIARGCGMRLLGPLVQMASPCETREESLD
jgi:hypothetical protein